jgi:prephenate dehydrogenase
MKLNIIGDGSFGSFMKELLAPHFELCEDADSVMLAVPISAYEEVSSKNKGKHLINVCSVQKPSTDICLKHSDRVTSIHPLFGRRTPSDKRHSILTLRVIPPEDTWYDETCSSDFTSKFSMVSSIAINYYTPEEHDQLMAKTHVAAVLAAQQMKIYIDRAKDIPDEFIPNSFRLLRDFVKTLDDMPKGTIESIMANPYF